MDDDGDQPPSRPRKFTPKRPASRKNKNKPVPLKPEETVEEDEAVEEVSEHLLRRVNEHLTRGKSKAEKKPTQVAFGPGPQVLRTFDKPRRGTGRSNNGLVMRDSAPVNEQNLISSPSTAGTDGVAEDLTPDGNVVLQKRKEYKEPWDYENSYYPITLPLRQPYSGNPELLDEAEFGKAAANLEYDENCIDAASELGLREKSDKPQMLFLQLPLDIPTIRPVTGVARREMTNRPMASGQKVAGGTSNSSSGASNRAKGKEIINRTTHSEKSSALNTDCNLDLPGGFMGKMLVYKSGAVKLKLGEILYDVSPGADCTFAQDVVAVNTTDEHCCALGELGKRAVVTADIDCLLDSEDLETRP